MSSLWTPDGERPIRRQPPEGPPAAAARPGPPAGAELPGAELPGGPGAADDAEVMAQLEALRQQLAAAPAEAVVANHAYGLFELAAVHLATSPPQLPQARLAIDALAALVEGLAGRLGEAEASLADGLAQLRLAFVEVARITPAGG